VPPLLHTDSFLKPIIMKFKSSVIFWMLLNASTSSSFVATSRSSVRIGGSVQSDTNNVRPGNYYDLRVPFATISRGGELSSLSLTSSSVETSTTSSTMFVTPENLSLLSERGRQAVTRLMENDKDGYQAHVYSNWPEAGSHDDDKRRLAEQVGFSNQTKVSSHIVVYGYINSKHDDEDAFETHTNRLSLFCSLYVVSFEFLDVCFGWQLADLDSSYPGGLASYLSKARTLLKESAEGINPFEDYEAVVPEGESLSFDGEGTMSFSEAEQLGIQAMEGAVFVLVAGGLGERLGYSGIKLSLETNLCTNTSYLHMYIKYIKAMEFLARSKTGKKDIRIPLVIMTSGDTDPMTRQLLADNKNFGMEDDMLSIVCQDKVAALKDGNAGLALEDDDRWTIQTKPHGHGDVHQLLHREGMVEKWEKEGRTHVVFLQDTNALVINSIIPTLGVSVSKGFHMNSICVPRLAGEAAGAIARLE